MTKHSLDLLDNAIDSLNEALSKYEAGEAGDYKAYKFAIINMAHFLELIFKYHISQQHPLLIYKNPFAQKLDKSTTITFWDSVNFISNETGQIGINTEFRKDLDWLKKLRNNIEHHKFEMEVSEVKETLGRIFMSLMEFLNFFSEVELEDYVPEHLSKTFKILSDEYEKKRHEAIKEADEAEASALDGVRHKNLSLVDFKRYDCPECENPTMIPNEKSSSGYKCTFCGNEYNGEILVTCDCCGIECEEYEMEFWDMGDGISEKRCYYCSGRYYAEKDD